MILNTAKPYSKSSGNGLCLTALQTLKVYAFLFGLTLMPYAIADDQQQSKLDILQSNISELQKTLTARNEQQTDLETDLERVETEASTLNTSIRELSNNIKTVEKQLIGKQKEKANLEVNISGQNDTIIAQLRSAQKIGDQEPIKLLLNQEDPQKIARMFKYYDYFLQARSAKIEQYLISVTALNDIIQSLSLIHI